MRNYNTAIDIFNQWALSGKDKGMENGHSKSVNRMFHILIENYFKSKDELSVLDLGCGNGWMVREFSSHFPNIRGVGLDGSKNMIDKARQINPSGNYICKDINQWSPNDKYNLILSMEVMYYLKDPAKVLKNLYSNGLKTDGILMIGIDHYKENAESLSWGGDLSVDIHTLSVDEWIDNFHQAGFSKVKFERYNQKDNWGGTLIIYGIKIEE